MLIYKDCISINTGIMPPHTLQIGKAKISIVYMNNLNYKSIIGNLNKNNFKIVAIALDKKNMKYYIYQSGNGVIAIKNEIVKKLTIPEMIKKYNLVLTEDEYKRIFNID